MAKEFTYKQRSEKSVDKRASQSGNDFQGIFIDDVSVYTVRKGDNTIRILPPTWDAETDYGFPVIEHYGLELYVHYGVGPHKASVICNSKMKNKACPICEAQAKLLAAGDEAEAKELKAGKRVLVYLIDRKEEEKGPQVWAMPWTLDKDIAKLTKDKETGEVYWIDDPDAGYDVYFEKDGEGIATKYTGVVLAKRPSKVSSKHIKHIVATPLPETLQWRTYKEIQALYSGGVKDEDDEPVAKKNTKRPPVDEDDDEPPVKKRRVIDDDDDDKPVAKKRRAPVEDEDDEPAPVKKRRPPVDEDDEEPAPKRRRAPVVDDDDEPPVKKRRAPVEDEDDEPVVKKPRRHEPADEDDIPVRGKPKNRARDAVDDDDIPDEWPKTAKRKAPVDDDDEPPVKKRRAPVEDDDEPAPVKKRRPPVEDEDDEPPVKKRRPPVDDDDEEENSSIRKRLAARRGG